MLRGPLHLNSLTVYKKFKFQVSPCDPLDQNLQGWSLGTCILTPSLVTLIHSRATVYGSGGEAWRGADPRGRKLRGVEEKGGSRSEECADHQLKPFLLLSPDSLTTWPEPSPQSYSVGEGQNLPPADHGALRG